MTSGFKYEIKHASEKGLARVGTITTPHGEIQTPAFIPVGTKATVKSVLPGAMEDLGAQALLSNAYHLYLQPGPDVLDEAGGLGSFMNWDKPTFTDSGGFQVLSLGVGFKKVLAMDAQTFRSDQVIAGNKERLAHVDNEGVTFKSHLDGSMHRFSAEISMQIQHKMVRTLCLHSMSAPICITLAHIKSWLWSAHITGRFVVLMNISA
jgi:queuine tRNA-ribosyltransferase